MPFPIGAALEAMMSQRTVINIETWMRLALAFAAWRALIPPHSVVPGATPAVSIYGAEDVMSARAPQVDNE